MNRDDLLIVRLRRALYDLWESGTPVDPAEQLTLDHEAQLAYLPAETCGLGIVPGSRRSREHLVQVGSFSAKEFPYTYGFSPSMTSKRGEPVYVVRPATDRADTSASRSHFGREATS